ASRRRHTRLVSDWSSDVCSSDLDEVAGESGVSHFLEHMVFKGTERRDAIQVNRDFDRIGADNNAFTSEEITCYHAAVLPEYMPQIGRASCRERVEIAEGGVD